MDIEDFPAITKEPPVISASYKTDIPAHYMDSFMSALEAGRIEVANPYNAKQTGVVSLSPATLRVITWWSKDYAPWIRVYETPRGREILSRYVNYFNFTINGERGYELEPGLQTTLGERFAQLQWLVATFGVDAMNVRFDPIVFYHGAFASGPDRDDLAAQQNNLLYFEPIVAQCAALGLPTVSTAFVNHYNKTISRMRRYGHELYSLSVPQKTEIGDRLHGMASSYGVDLRWCAQQDVSEFTATGASVCTDSERIGRLLAARGLSIPAVPRKEPNRPGCRCMSSVDVGDYKKMPCGGRCLYCYANPGH
jgi:hypothetical protein